MEPHLDARSSGDGFPRRLRLLKAVVQFVFVVDDGVTLTERIAEPVVIPASGWPSWATEEYPVLLAQLEGQLQDEDADHADGDGR